VTIKFNFYDIYGFALPGFLLLAVLWFPFGLIENRWPDAEFSSALIGIIFAYFAGHVLQQVALHAIPSHLPNGRYPSSVFLDENDHTFSRKFKEGLAEQIKSTFPLANLDVQPNTSDGRADDVRRDAFFLCRSALIKSKTVVYAEQFEGLYALMRGMCAAFAVGVVYYLGWSYSAWLPAWWSGFLSLLGVVVALIAAVVVTRNRNKFARGGMIISLLAAAFAAGQHFGAFTVASSEHRWQLIAAAVFCFFAAERCHAGYREFAAEFTKAVYRDFSNYEKPDGGSGSLTPGAGTKPRRTEGPITAKESDVDDDDAHE
jgi:hypothetical protein